jgi:hypothetical protein
MRTPAGLAIVVAAAAAVMPAVAAASDPGPPSWRALGSHANSSSSALYLGRSAVEGVGCDDTVGPFREIRPAVALVPAGGSSSLRTFPWLGYVGCSGR